MHGATRQQPSRCPTESGHCSTRRSASRLHRVAELATEARSSCDRRHCRPPTADALAGIVGAENCVVDDHDRLLRAGGKSTLDLLRRKDSGVQDAPDAVLLPGSTRTRSPRSCGYCAQRSIAVVPFGGGTSVVGGLDPHPRSSSRPSSRWICAASNELHSLDEVSGEAELGAGRHRPGRRTTARRTWLLARALPAELPVRHHRRIRRHPIVGPGLGGLRPIQRHGPRSARGHPGGRARPRPRTGIGRGPGPAPTDHRLRGRLRRHHPRAGPGAPGARRPPATRRGRSPTSPPAPTPCAPSSRPAPARP